MNQSQLSSFVAHNVCRTGTSIAREVFEHPSVVNEQFFDSGLMQRGVHRLAEARMAGATARSVHAHRRSIDDDADRLRSPDEEPGPGI